MSDATFRGLLIHTAHIFRASVIPGIDLSLPTPAWQLVTTGIAVRLRPILAEMDATLMGKFPEVEVVGYCEPQDIRPVDRLCRIMSSTTLAVGAEAGEMSVEVEDAVQIAVGDSVSLIGAEEGELAVVAGVEDNTVILNTPLRRSYSEGDELGVVECYEVLGVLDESGVGHHQKLVLKRTQA